MPAKDATAGRSIASDPGADASTVWGKLSTDKSVVWRKYLRRGKDYAESTYEKKTAEMALSPLGSKVPDFYSTTSLLAPCLHRCGLWFNTSNPMCTGGCVSCTMEQDTTDKIFLFRINDLLSMVWRPSEQRHKQPVWIPQKTSSCHKQDVLVVNREGKLRQLRTGISRASMGFWKESVNSINRDCVYWWRNQECGLETQTFAICHWCHRFRGWSPQTDAAQHCFIQPIINCNYIVWINYWLLL